MFNFLQKLIVSTRHEGGIKGRTNLFQSTNNLIMNNLFILQLLIQRIKFIVQLQNLIILKFHLLFQREDLSSQLRTTASISYLPSQNPPETKTTNLLQIISERLNLLRISLHLRLLIQQLPTQSFAPLSQLLSFLLLLLQYLHSKPISTSNGKQKRTRTNLLSFPFPVSGFIHSLPPLILFILSQNSNILNLFN